MLDHPHPDPTTTEAPAPLADAADPIGAAPEAAAWSAKVESLLTEAAALCADHDVDPHAFMHAAWRACLDSRPGLREQIADAQLMQQVENLRNRGVVGEA